MSSEESPINEFIVRAVGSQIRTDMSMVSKAFYANVEKYAFLFDGDIIETQKMLIAACFPTNKKIVEKSDSKDEEDKLHFDMNIILEHIPEEMKNLLYERVMKKFLTNLDVDDINGKKG
ncbi:MAG: hypothetical protein N2A99_06450 [Carnobacterium alterfunditum]